MAELGIDIADEFPKPVTDEVVHAADVVVTMGCGDACALYPFKKYQDWPIPDPNGQPIGRVRAIRDEIQRRVHSLLAELSARDRAERDALQRLADRLDNPCSL
jgi:protein-tyrosine-phosphatase